MNPQGNELNLLSLENHEDHIAGKGFTSMTHCNLVHKFIPMRQAINFRMRKQQWIKNGKSSRRYQNGNWRTSRAIWRHRHLKNAELEQKVQKYRGRVVFRGDIVRDDFEAYAVFAEQGSSASQVTAAKVMDVIARLPDCDGQAAEVKLEDAPRLVKIPRSECPDV